MSYRDLDGETPAETDTVTAATNSRGGPHSPPTEPAPTRQRRWLLPIALTLLVGLVAGGVALRLHDGDPGVAAPAGRAVDASASTASTTANVTARPQPSPAATSVTTATTASAPVDPLPPGDAPEPATATDGGSAALQTVKTFLPAWALPGDVAHRRSALTPVAARQLVDELAVVDPARVPPIIGDPAVTLASPSEVVVDVPTAHGTARLTVQPTSAGWRVTAVSLAPLGAG